MDQRNYVCGVPTSRGKTEELNNGLPERLPSYGSMMMNRSDRRGRKPVFPLTFEVGNRRLASRARIFIMALE